MTDDVTRKTDDGGRKTMLKSFAPMLILIRVLS
jgi:hypothetical protein